MKRFHFTAIAAFALLVPVLASAQDVTLVYRHELRGMVTVPSPQPQPAAAAVERVPLSPQQVIAKHEAMVIGFRANANARGGAAVATVHCERLIAQAHQALRRNN